MQLERGIGAAGLSRTALSGWWCIAFVAEGRGTIVATSVAMLACALIFRAAARPMLKQQMIAAALGLTVYSILFVAPTIGHDATTITRPEATQAAGLNQRGELWTQALAMSRDHPWLGVGPLHYAYYPNHLAAHPHNALLQWTSEWGLPATLLLASLLAWGLWCWIGLWRNVGLQPPQESQQQLAMVLTASAFAGAIHAMVSGIIVMPLSQLMLAAVAGLMLGLYQSNRVAVASTQGQAPWRTRLLGGLLVGATIGLLAPDLITGVSGHQVTPATTLSADGPRYWMLGEFPR
jgi:O-antigen ligase